LLVDGGYTADGRHCRWPCPPALREVETAVGSNRSDADTSAVTRAGNSDHALVLEHADFAIRHAEQGFVDIVIVLSQRRTQPLDRAWRVGEPRAHVRHGDLADAWILKEFDVLACLVLRVREDLGNRVDRPARHLERVAPFD
jgi:hypothetical protein